MDCAPIYFYLTPDYDQLPAECRYKEIGGWHYKLHATMFAPSFTELQKHDISGKIVQNRFALITKSRYGEHEPKLLQILRHHLPSLEEMVRPPANMDTLGIPFKIDERDIALLKLMT